MNKYIPYNITCPLASCSRSKRSSTQSPAGTPGGRLSFWRLAEDFLLNKQIIHRNLFLYDVAMFVLLQSERSNQCEEKRFGSLRLFSEDTKFLLQFLLIFLADFEFALVEFHLTDVDGFIFPVYQQVYLSSLFCVAASPWANQGLYSRNSQGMLDFVYMV